MAAARATHRHSKAGRRARSRRPTAALGAWRAAKLAPDEKLGLLPGHPAGVIYIKSHFLPVIIQSIHARDKKHALLPSLLRPGSAHAFYLDVDADYGAQLQRFRCARAWAMAQSTASALMFALLDPMVTKTVYVPRGCQAGYQSLCQEGVRVLAMPRQPNYSVEAYWRNSAAQRQEMVDFAWTSGWLDCCA
eukprot:g32927.t1